VIRNHHRDPRCHINSAIANSTSISRRDRKSTAVDIALFMDSPSRLVETPAKAVLALGSIGRLAAGGGESCSDEP
jgi:hypothetical protein